jgi:hypothetical protein
MVAAVQGRQCRGPAAVDGVVHGCGAMWSSSGLRISTGRCGVELRRWPRGQEGPGINGGEQLRWCTRLPALCSGRNSGRCRAEVGDGGLGVIPGPEAKLRWWVAGPGTQRGGGFTAAQMLRAVEQCRAMGRRCSRVQWRLWRRIGCGGGRGGAN